MTKYLIIIPSFNRRDDLRETIRSMKFLQENVGFELVVVDDCSTDGTAEMLQNEFPRVKLLKNDPQLGPAASRNRAANEFEAEFYIFLDSDIEVPQDWSEKIQELASPKKIIAGKIVNLYDKEVEVGPRRSTFIGGSISCKPERANVGSSCHLVVPRDCFRSINGFDEEISYYFEDSNLCITSEKAGWPVKFFEDIVIYHKNRGYKKGNRIRMHVQNRTYAMSKAYLPHPHKLLAFFILNTIWVVLQSMTRLVSFQFYDSICISRGWFSGNMKMLRRIYSSS